MSCTWISKSARDATDFQWEAHLKICQDCRDALDWETMTPSPDEERLANFYQEAVAVPLGMVDSVMDRLHRTVHTQRGTRWLSRKRWITYVGAAIVVASIGIAYRAPVAQAMTDVIDRIHTTFFADKSQPMTVNVTQVSPEQKKQVEQDLLTPVEHQAAAVFAKHKAEILAAYQQLSEGQTHGLRFADGSAFIVSRQSTVTDLKTMEAQSTIQIPVPTALPLGLVFDEGSVRVNGMGTETAEVNMIFTTGGNVKQNQQFEYQKYTDPTFSLGKGNYLSINVVWADGILGTDYIGDFDLKKNVSVQGQPGVLMKYKETWAAAPGIVRLSFGKQMNGHHFMVQMDSRGLTPDQLLHAAQEMTWQ